MKSWTFAALVCAFLNASQAVAVFVNGVERFDGKTKDLAICEQFPTRLTEISQSDASSITGAGYRDYTIRALKAGMGATLFL